MPRKLAVLVAVLAVCMSFASSAFADNTFPASLSFDHAVLDTPSFGDVQVVSDSTQPLTVTAQTEESGGDFTIAPSDFSAPTYDFTSPAPGTLTVALANTASGNFDDTTGAVALTADFVLTFTLNGYGTCSVDAGAKTLSTGTTLPEAGQAFPANPEGIDSGNGAFGVSWSTLPAGTGAGCAEIGPAIDGPGGIWISRGIAPTITTPPATKIPAAAPALSATATPPATVQSGQTATVNVNLANTGGADTQPVKVCLAAKQPLSPASQCVTATPGAASTRKIAFKVKTGSAKAGTYKLTLTATGLKPQTVTLKVTAGAKLSIKLAKVVKVATGRTASVSVTVTNPGGAATKAVKVCLSAKRPLSPADQCVSFTPGAHSARKLTFKLKTGSAKAGSYKLRLTATGLKAQTVTLEVKR